MTSFEQAAGWFAAAGGVWTALRHVTTLRAIRARPDTAEPGDVRSGWKGFATGLLLILTGVLLATGWMARGAARWLLCIILAAILVWFVSSDLASWRRSRARRGSASAAD